MWPFISQLDLIRYLCVWRVNSSLVRLPRCPAHDLSLILGRLIAERLPTREAGPWRKALATWDAREPGPGELQARFEAPWPLEAVLLFPPTKSVYGPGELIVWELKLLGGSADHGLFLEVILPALEQAATTTDPRWHRANKMWGRFDLYATYVARGAHWEPLVQAGRLDLGYHPPPTQWAEGLSFEAQSERIYDRLIWLTPFDLPPSGRQRASRLPRTIPDGEVPTLRRLFEALVARMAVFLPGRYTTPDDVWNGLEAEERAALQAALEQADLIPLHRHNLKPAPKGWPGRWIGTQFFPFFPRPLLPYLELASILHLGRQTHFGCGTFGLA